MDRCWEDLEACGMRTRHGHHLRTWTMRVNRRVLKPSHLLPRQCRSNCTWTTWEAHLKDAAERACCRLNETLKTNYAGARSSVSALCVCPCVPCRSLTVSCVRQWYSGDTMKKPTRPGRDRGRETGAPKRGDFASVSAPMTAESAASRAQYWIPIQIMQMLPARGLSGQL